MHLRNFSCTGWSVVGLVAIVLIGIPLRGNPAAAESQFGPIKAAKVNAKKAELGKRLFFDPRLSGDAAISCASCHIPEKGFADGLALSKAYPGRDRKSTRLNSSHSQISYAVFCLKQKKKVKHITMKSACY